MYKRICAMVLFVLLLLPVCFSSAAEPETTTGETEYRFNEGRFSVSVPSSLFVITHDSSAEDLAVLGISGATADELLDDTLLLDAVQFDERTIELAISLPYLHNPNTDIADLKDFNRLSEKELIEEFGDMLQSENWNEMLAEEDFPERAENVVVSDSGIEVYQHSQARFVLMPMDEEVDGATVYGEMYMTIYGAEQYCIFIKRYDAPLDAQDRAMLKQVVDSVRFDAAPYSKPVPSTATNIAKAAAGGAIKALILGGIGAIVGSISVAAKKKKKKDFQNQPTAPYGTSNYNNDRHGLD